MGNEVSAVEAISRLHCPLLQQLSAVICACCSGHGRVIFARCNGYGQGAEVMLVTG